MNQKRGQAAMEFVMTYGWALIAAIIVVALVAYFGIFSPASITGNVVAVSAPFYSTATQAIMTPAEIRFEIVNNGGSQVTVTQVVITGTGPSVGISCGLLAPTVIDDRENALMITNCMGPLNSGDQFSGDIEIKYFKAGTTLEQTAGGKIKAAVQ